MVNHNAPTQTDTVENVEWVIFSIVYGNNYAVRTVITQS